MGTKDWAGRARRERRGRVVTGVSFPPEYLRRIDQAAARSGLSRSAFIRAALGRALVEFETASEERVAG